MSEPDVKDQRIGLSKRSMLVTVEIFGGAFQHVADVACFSYLFHLLAFFVLYIKKVFYFTIYNFLSVYIYNIYILVYDNYCFFFFELFFALRPRAGFLDELI